MNNFKEIVDKTNNEDQELIIKIAEKAVDLGLTDDVVTIAMDITVANSVFNLRLKQLLNADDFNFVHDIKGIENNVNRTTYEFEGSFIPRFAGV